MRSTHGLRVAMTLALLVFGLTAMGVAGEPTSDQEIVLTGQLWMDSDERYRLTDADSGESILLKGEEEKLSEHIGLKVEVTGTWVEKENDRKVFKVEPVKRFES